MHYGVLGLPFGSEQYFEGGTVLWKAAGGECLHGAWEVESGLICFTYEDAPEDRRCWAVALSPEGLSAWMPDAPDMPLQETARERTPLDCPGPGWGM